MPATKNTHDIPITPSPMVFYEVTIAPGLQCLKWKIPQEAIGNNTDRADATKLLPAVAELRKVGACFTFLSGE